MLNKENTLLFSKYLATRFYLLGKPIFNMDLNNLMYHISLDCEDKLDKKLFTEDFIIYEFGFMIPAVHYHYIYYGAMGIMLHNLKGEEMKEIEQILINENVADIVEENINKFINLKGSKNKRWIYHDYSTKENQLWIDKYGSKYKREYRRLTLTKLTRIPPSSLGGG